MLHKIRDTELVKSLCLHTIEEKRDYFLAKLMLSPSMDYQLRICAKRLTKLTSVNIYKKYFWQLYYNVNTFSGVDVSVNPAKWLIF